MAPFKPTWKQPSHPDILEVVEGDNMKSFSKGSCSRASVPADSILTILSNPPLALSEKAYSTVQISRSQHVELNCDFLYLNHSCEPSLELHCLTGSQNKNDRRNSEERDAQFQIEVRVAKRLDSAGQAVNLEEGDELTFFYPSTEWDMAQPFQCNCGSKRCLKQISGAKDMPAETLKGYFLNEHIQNMLKEKA